MIKWLKENGRSLIVTLVISALVTIAYLAYLVLVGIPSTQQYLRSLV